MTKKQGKKHDRLYAQFGRAVARYRIHRLESTQQMLADKVGKTRAAIANIEGGRTRVYLSDVLVLAKAFNMNPGALIRSALEDDK